MQVVGGKETNLMEVLDSQRQQFIFIDLEGTAVCWYRDRSPWRIS